MDNKTPLGLTPAGVLVCPKCRGPLREEGSGVTCLSCCRVYRRNAHGFLDFSLDPMFQDIESTTENYAAMQKSSWRRFYSEFLKPWVEHNDGQRILEIGCGLGLGIRYFCQDGFDAYGLDLPCLSRFWAREGHDVRRLVCADGTRTPFPDGFFDAVFTLGTIEHIGTTNSHSTLDENYREIRRAFAQELLRVTKPQGRILVTCPNKSFPLDFHHAPVEVLGPSPKRTLRRTIHKLTRLNLHRPIGRYHLLSFGEIRGLFGAGDEARSIRAISPKYYFAYTRTEAAPMIRVFKSAIKFYMEHLPGPLRASFLNPFLIVEIRR